MKIRSSRPELAFCIILFLFSFNFSLAQTTINVSGEITENTTWSADIVKVNDTISINAGVTLTIEAGTYVEFQGWYPLMVYGKIIAIGTETDSITFTISDTTGFSNFNSYDGSWHGIRIFSPSISDTSMIDYCIIEYCKARLGGGEDTQGSGILLWNNSKLRITNSIIRNNYAGGDGGGIYLSDSYAKITHNKFYNNSSRWRGGGLAVWSGELKIENNIFSNNFARWGGGGLSITTCDPDFINNIISNNESEGEGGGIYLYRSDLLAINNTICFNKGKQGGGIFTDTQINPEFYNNIIWGNESVEAGDQVYMLEFNPDINFYNCNIQGNKTGIGLVPGSVYFGEYLNNIDTIPDFILSPGGSGVNYNGMEANWSLMSGSACINRGTKEVPGASLPALDYGQNKRIAHGEIDMGAYEFYQPLIEVCDSIKENTTWTADTVKVNCNIIIPDTYTLTINAGTVVQFQGSYSIEVYGTLLALGTETDSIIFTIDDTTGFSDITIDDGGWNGIRFYSFATNDSSKILYSKLEYSKKVTGNSNDEWFGGAIYANSCYRLLISNSTIRNNIAQSGGGIYCRNSPIEIQKTTIIDNISTTWKGGGLVFIYSDTRISNCIISNNKTRQEGGGIVVIGCEPTISNCIISNNLTESYGGGGIFSESDAQPLIIGNEISNNTSTSVGGGLFLQSSAIIMNNIISNNYARAGGGLEFQTEADILLSNNIISNNTAQYFAAINMIAGNSEIINNTLVNNYASSSTGGMVAKATAMKIENTIFWGNTSSNNNTQISIYSGGAKPDILHSNIQGGFESINGVPEDYPARFENNIDAMPGFIQPTDSAGNGFDGTIADWSLLGTSPSVNTGNPLTDEGDLMPLDIYGNPRIHSGTIDMGAVENQSGLPVITEQPLNYTKCTGDSAELSVKVTGDAFYQWQLNLSDIPGATRDSYNIDSIAGKHDGNYQCIISNAYGIVKSNPAWVSVNSPPEILSQPEDTWIQDGENSSLSIFASGTDPQYQWGKNAIELPDEQTNILRIPEAGQEDEGFYECIVYNSCGSDTSEAINLYLVPQLCIVTVDPGSGNNLIVWEKKSSAPILSYNVYRESEAAGIYNLLTTQVFDKLSIYVDTVADPTVQSYLYKITAIDTTGIETDIDLCQPHKTIHLIVSPDLQNDATNLQWDFYHGFDYQTYTIYRSATGLNFDPVHSLSANIKSWSDRDPNTEDHYYRIAVQKPDPCYPTGSGKKADTGPYNHSLSNMDDNKLKLGQIPPDTITLTNYSIPEESGAGTLIGKLLTTDQDSVDSFTYKFVPGEGDADNISFTLLGDLLFSSESFDYETKNQYLVRIRTTDEAGNYCEVPFIIQVLDIDETTGLLESETSMVKAFPNPFSKETRIRFPNPEGESFRLVLMDLSGKVVRMQENIRSDEFILKRKGLEKGIYILELGSEKKSEARNFFQLKLVIQ